MCCFFFGVRNMSQSNQHFLHPLSLPSLSLEYLMNLKFIYNWSLAIFQFHSLSSHVERWIMIAKWLHRKITKTTHLVKFETLENFNSIDASKWTELSSDPSIKSRIFQSTSRIFHFPVPFHFSALVHVHLNSLYLGVFC